MLIVVVVVIGGDKMKVIVVVVNHIDKQRFNGNDLMVIDTNSTSNIGKLIIKRRDEKEALAVFSMWQYWYRIEDPTLDQADEEIGKHKICCHCGKTNGPDGGRHLCRKCLEKIADQT